MYCNLNENVTFESNFETNGPPYLVVGQGSIINSIITYIHIFEVLCIVAAMHAATCMLHM